MAIATAVQRGSFVYVYDEKGRQLTTLAVAGIGLEGGLKGYTRASVSIRRNGFIYTYNEKGHQISVTPAR